MSRIGHLRFAAPIDGAGPLQTDAIERLLRYIDHLGYRGWIGCDAIGDDSMPAWRERFPHPSARGLVWGMPREALRLNA